MKHAEKKGATATFLAIIASFTMMLAGIAGVTLAGAASAATGQGECPAGYSQIGVDGNLNGVQSIDWNPNADAAAVHSGGGVDADAFKIFYKPEPIEAWNWNKPGTAKLGLSNVVWCGKDKPQPPTCNETQDLVNGACVPKCAAGEVRNEGGTCVVPACPEGQERVSGTCVPKCAANEVRNANGTCEVPKTPSNPSGSSSTPAQVTSTPVSAPAAVTAEPTTVSAPAAATVAQAPAKAPAKVTVPAKATLPAAVPAGGGSTAPAVPLWAMALVLVGLIAAGASVLGLSLK